jgi:outer membrane lipase/esterase
MFKTKTLRATAAAALLLACTLGQAATNIASPYTALAIFGDSLSDSGNNRIATGFAVGPIPTSNSYIPSGMPPYASGTYSNGPVWANAFALNLGLAGYALPSFAGGADYAAGGAVTAGTFVYPPSATQQVNSFLAGAGSLPSTGLYVIAVGANDVRDVGAALAGGASPAIIGAQAAAYATNVGLMVDSLQAQGAQHIIVWNVPDVGKTPALLASPVGSAGVATAVSAAFNQSLAARLAGEAGVSIFDTFSYVDAMVANPAAFGLSNVSDACGALVNTCSNSLGTSLFYDGIHPTAAGHALIAGFMTSAALAAVPEASSWLLLGLGLAVVLRRGQSGGLLVQA